LIFIKVIQIQHLLKLNDTEKSNFVKVFKFKYNTC